MSYNGSCLIGMKGDHCAALATDRRYGVKFQMISCNFPKVFKIHDTLLLGLSGLATDIITFAKQMKMEANLYRLREHREIKPKVFANLVASSLYAKRFGPYFIEPIIAGLEEDGTPYIANTDLIGCIGDEDNFLCCGTGDEMLLGACESFYRDGMESEELFEVCAQSLMSGTDRDAYSGWGGVVYVITPQGITAKTLKTRMD